MDALIARQRIIVTTTLLTLGLGALLAAGLVPGVSALLVAILIGAFVGNVGAVPASVEMGVSWASRKLLRIGIILLGFRLSLAGLAEIGVKGVAVLLTTVVVTFIGTLLFGRLLAVPKTTRMLVATGFSVCGASAVVAMSSVVDPKGQHEEETAQAVALVTIFGTVLMFVLPPLVSAMALSETQAGLWIGASVHEVAQVVAAGGMVSAGALAVATVAKLGRVVLLAPLVSVMGVIEYRRTRKSAAVNRPPMVPLFIAGFLAAVLVRTFLPLPPELWAVLEWAANWLLAGAMLGLGFGVKFKKMIATGSKPALLGMISTVIAAAISFGTIMLLDV